MNRILRILSCAVCCVAFAAEPDAAGCKDSPLFTRMPGFRIVRCENRDFDAHTFKAKGKDAPVEGRYTEIMYGLQDGAKEPSRVQVLRNYEAAALKVGGAVMAKDDEGNLHLRVVRDGRETWVHVNAYITSQYSVFIVEKGAMAQEVTADAAAFTRDIKASGHVAVYGLRFDTGKAELRPESEGALREIAGLLKASPVLKLNVVGHTDNVAALDLNMRLSQARAEAVVQALVSRFGIAPQRLKPFGVGPLAPVAPNDAEEGRAKNRRVELVRP